MMSEDITKHFIELIQVATGSKDCLSKTPTPQEWQQLYQVAYEQAVLGISFAGIRKLAEQRQQPPQELYYQWLAMAMQINCQNEIVNGRIGDFARWCKERALDFAGCIMKGQSVGKLYGELSELRQSGDIDWWISCGRETICQLSIKEFGKVAGLTYHHIHFPLFSDVEVEAHFIPGYLNSPFHNRSLQKFFKQYEPTEGYVNDAPQKFNLVYLLLHCYKHFLERGVGLRQVMDYYYVLVHGEGLTVHGYEKQLKDVGLYKFAGAMMWVLGHVFGLEREKMIVAPDDKEGRFLLNEIMQTGNFGHHDKRYNWNIGSAWKRFLANQRWNMHLLWHYPSEVLWSPVASIYRYIKVKGWEKNINKKR